jgi:transcriptional activator for dhaKLM operon
MVLFSKYSWPGNIRELEKVLARAAIQTGASELIGSMHLPETILNPTHTLEQSIEIGSAQPLEQIEREAILQVARMCKGNTTEMARILGISRTTIWRKLKEFNITADDFRARSIRN